MNNMKWLPVNCKQLADFPKDKIFAFAVRNDNYQEPYHSIRYEALAYMDRWDKIKFYCELPKLPELPEYDWEHCIK